MRGWVVLVLALYVSQGVSPRRAHAEDDSFRRAKALFLEGKAEYEQHHYEVALHLFEGAYAANARPELLFNMAACLEQLDRPREAADRMRAFVERVPNDPQRASITASIEALDARARAHALPSPTAVADPERTALEERIALLEARLNHEAAPRSRRGLVIGLSVAGGAILVGTAIALGVIFGQGDSYTRSSYGGGPLQATR